MFRWLVLSALTLISPLQDASDPSQVREIDAIECRLSVPDYTGFALELGGPEGIAKARHWKQIPSTNPFMHEYALPAEIVVAGTYRTRRIAFTSNAILAILDLPDPAAIAHAENIANAMDPQPLLDSLGRGDAPIKFRKFLGENIVREETVPAAKGEAFGSHTMVARTISNATSHPGKTLYGCAYRMELLDRDGKPL